MQKTLGLIRAFAREEDGVTAIEYGLLAALIAVAIIASVTLVGTQLQNVFTYIQTQLAGAMTAA
ncbi:Flp family type IVb pilin [Paraburkholderia sp. A1RO-5L]|uniref:Flp family type IVb pilin n=1 Tax=unclassified Paraburkholderia TaxID=2615204 RepID=UPI003B7E32FF